MDGGRFPNSISNRARDTFYYMNRRIPGLMLPAGSSVVTGASARAAQAFGTPTLLDVGLAARAGAATIVRGGVSWTLFEGVVVGSGVGLIASISVGLAAEIGLGIGSYVAAVSTHPCAGK